MVKQDKWSIAALPLFCCALAAIVFVSAHRAPAQDQDKGDAELEKLKEMEKIGRNLTANIVKDAKETGPTVAGRFMMYFHDAVPFEQYLVDSCTGRVWILNDGHNTWTEMDRTQSVPVMMQQKGDRILVTPSAGKSK